MHINTHTYTGAAGGAGGAAVPGARRVQRLCAADAPARRARVQVRRGVSSMCIYNVDIYISIYLYIYINKSTYIVVSTI